MRISSFYFIVCVMALSAILPGCDNDHIPPYASVVINEPPVLDEETFMQKASLEGTWQLVSNEYDIKNYRDSAIFFTFTVAEQEYSCHYDQQRLSPYSYGLSQKGKLAIRRGGEEEDIVPYEYVYVGFSDPLACYGGLSEISIDDYDFDVVPNVQLGDSVFYCRRDEPSALTMYYVRVSPKTGNRYYDTRALRFDKVE